VAALIVAADMTPAFVFCLTLVDAQFTEHVAGLGCCDMGDICMAWVFTTGLLGIGVTAWLSVDLMAPALTLTSALTLDGRPLTCWPWPTLTGRFIFEKVASPCSEVATKCGILNWLILYVHLPWGSGAYTSCMSTQLVDNIT
jgi:hypothetical protein